jgi:hypothetical protein
MLNFEIVSSIGSSAGYGRISQQQEILYGFCLFCYSLVCKALVLCWPNVNLFINIILGPIYFSTPWATLGFLRPTHAHAHTNLHPCLWAQVLTAIG